MSNFKPIIIYIANKKMVFPLFKTFLQKCSSKPFHFFVIVAVYFVTILNWQFIFIS